MVKMFEKFTRPEELLTKMVAENTSLKNENKALREELDKKDAEIGNLESIIRQYQENCNDGYEDIIAEEIEDDVVTYMEWFNSAESEDLINAYANL